MRRNLSLRASGGNRMRGGLDMTDLWIGLGLLIVLPVMVYVTAGLFMGVGEERVGPEWTMGKKPKMPEPPWSADELNERIRSVENVIGTNARNFLKLWDAVEDGILKERYRAWSEVTLTHGLQSVEEIKNRIDGHPKSASFIRQRNRLRELKSKAERDLERVKAANTLGV